MTEHTSAVSNDELQELAYSAHGEALSFGLSVDTFLRYFKTIRDRALAASEAAPAAATSGVNIALLQEIEGEFVRLEHLPAFIRRLQDEVRAARAAPAGQAQPSTPAAHPERVQLPERARAGIEVLRNVVESLLTTSRYVDEEGEATQALDDLSSCIADAPFRLAVPATPEGAAERLTDERILALWEESRAAGLRYAGLASTTPVLFARAIEQSLRPSSNKNGETK